MLCREMFENDRFLAERIGEYDPNAPDVADAQLSVMRREWDDERLKHGCDLLSQGIGLKNAARKVCSYSYPH
jgi:hypothetical protein